MPFGGCGTLLRGEGGDDEISGYGGNDRLEAGEGDDTVTGGSGVDDIKAGNSRDSAGGGEDFVHSYDCNVETSCVGTGDWTVYRDKADKLKGPPNCTTDLDASVSASASAAATASDGSPGGRPVLSSSQDR